MNSTAKNSETTKELLMWPTLGALQLSLGNTLPPRELIASWTVVVNSGNSGAYREKEEIIWASQYHHNKYGKQDQNPKVKLFRVLKIIHNTNHYQSSELS